MLDLYEEIGRGGECEVYLGCLRDRRNHQSGICAAKRVRRDRKGSEEIARRLIREAEVLRSCRYTGIPKYYALMGDSDDPILVQEYIAGENLWQTCMNKGKLSLREVTDIGIACCSILTRLHGHDPPILYMDMKPGNIMRSGDGKIYLVDFGSCREMEKAGESVFTGSRDGGLLGTPGFAPPEQFFSQDERMISPSTDLYALGAAMHALLCGIDPSASGLRPIGEFVPALAGSEMEKILGKCCSTGALLRYASAGELADALAGSRTFRKWNRTQVISAKGRKIAAIFLLLWMIAFLQYRDFVRDYHEILNRASRTEDMDEKCALYTDAVSLFPASGEAWLRLLPDLTKDGDLSPEEQYLLQICLYSGGGDLVRTIPCIEILEKENRTMYGRLMLAIAWKYLEYSPGERIYISYCLEQAQDSGSLSRTDSKRAEAGERIVRLSEPDLSQTERIFRWREVCEIIGSDRQIDVRCGDAASAVILCRETAGYCALYERELQEGGVTGEEFHRIFEQMEEFLDFMEGKGLCESRLLLDSTRTIVEQAYSVVLGEAEQEKN